jgi:uncharacterized membrane protein
MCIIAVVRRSNLADEEAFYVPFRQSYESLKNEFHSESQSRLDRALTIILVISILASVVTLVYVVVTPKQGEQFTEFYILGAGGMADDYPVNYTLGDSGKVIIGVVNHEYENVNYTIDIRLQNQSLQTIQQVNLEHNQTWQQSVTVTPPFNGTDMKLQFLLYKNGNYTEAYRDLHLWINVSEDTNE